jgi:hypothetical protein
MAIYLNRFMIAAELDNEDAYYNNLKQLVLNNLPQFSRFEKYNLMLFLENSCNEKIREGKNFTRELFNVHNEMLKASLYTSSDAHNIPLIRFRNIVRNALIIKEFQWTEDFISAYLDKLPEEHRESMYSYSLALLNFDKGKFDLALENISKVKFETYSVKFDVWSLKLKTEFELDMHEQALYSVDSYKHLLKKDKSSPEWMKKRVLGFINYYYRILKLKNERNKSAETDTIYLQNEISACSELIEKKWLLEKLSLIT